MQQPEGFEVGGPNHTGGSGSHSMALSRQAGFGTGPFILCFLLWASIMSNQQTIHFIYSSWMMSEAFMPVFVDNIMLTGTDSVKIDSIVQELPPSPRCKPC